MKTASIGSISSGTMREEDLIPCFISELEYLEHPQAKEHRDVWEELDQNDKETYVDECASLLEELFEALDECAPDFCYFGTHYGDGADFGFWSII